LRARHERHAHGQLEDAGQDAVEEERRGQDQHAPVDDARHSADRLAQQQLPGPVMATVSRDRRPSTSEARRTLTSSATGIGRMGFSRN
jgi:hypothetical protein